MCNPRKIINKSSISREKIKYNCLNLTGTTRAVYHVELYKSSISSHTIRYFLNLIRKRMYHVENTNLALQVIQSDIIFSRKARHYQKSTQSPQSKVFHQFILTTSSEKQCFCLQKRVLTSKTAVLSSQRSSEFQDGRHRRD